MANDSKTKTKREGVMPMPTATNPKHEQIVIRPQPGPQELFLSTTCDIIVYGGAAGGG